MGQLCLGLAHGAVCRYGLASAFPKPLRASPDPEPRAHPGVGSVADTPPLVVWPGATLDCALIPLASLANRLSVRWGLDLRADAPAGDSAQMARDFEEVLHKAKSPQIGGGVKVVAFS